MAGLPDASTSFAPPAMRPADGSALRRVLEACARPRLEGGLERLREAARGDLAGLAEAAAAEGLAPLALAHLRAAGVEHPELRLLRGYALREEVAARERERVLRRALEALRGTPVILLKGCALTREVYASAAHRPMDDLDLWVPPDQVEGSRRALLESGFSGPPAGGADERDHHAAPVVLEGVCVELHRHFPAGGIAQRWEQVFPRALPVEGLPGAFVPCAAHLLWQVWHHVFRSTLRWRPWRLIGVADLVGLLERGGIDWELIGPMPALARLHALTPLSPQVLRQLGGEPTPRARAGTVYAGWPQAKRWARESLDPPDWWLRLRHGIRGEGHWRCRIAHLRDLWIERARPYTGPPGRFA